MKNRILLPVTALLAILLIAGCTFQIVPGSGKVVSETRDISGFTRVTLAGTGNVIITQSESKPVKIEAEDNLIPYFKVELQGDTLVIGLKDEYMGTILQPTRPINFYVTLPDIEAVKLAGSGNILADKLQVKDFDITLAGSGDITLENLSAKNITIDLAGSGDISLGTVEADRMNSVTAGSGNIKFLSLNTPSVEVTILGSGNIHFDDLATESFTSAVSGSGDILASGEAADQHIETVGSGDFKGGELKGKNASVQISGSGNCRVWVTDMLDVTIAGSGNVAYSGQPSVSTHISGSGDVYPQE